jgi:hypothetical protein
VAFCDGFVIQIGWFEDISLHTTEISQKLRKSGQQIQRVTAAVETAFLTRTHFQQPSDFVVGRLSEQESGITGDP